MESNLEEVKKLFKESYKIISSEFSTIYLANDAVLNNFFKAYNYQLKNKLYYNEYNLLVFDVEDAVYFSRILPSGSTIFNMHVPEYNMGLFAFRYVQDNNLMTILTIEDN
jgi:hypothetical protein